MEILVDTWAFYAALSAEDLNHTRAVGQFRQLALTRDHLQATSTILVESVSLLQSRLGLKAVESFCSRLLPVVELIWLTQAQ